MRPIAIIFDMDGVIVDNHQYHLRSWLSFFEKYGISITEQEYKQQINGRVLDDILPKMLGKSLSSEAISEYGEEKESLYRELYMKDIRPTPGLIEFLEELEQYRISKAVATSAPPANVKFTMEHTGLTSYFPVIVDDTMVTKGKPDPEVYLTAAQKLDVPPAQCVVFEDALLGIQAGRNAGMKVVGVATTHTRKELELADTDLVINNFEGLHLSKLMDLLNL